jgi:archaellum component FlaC
MMMEKEVELNSDFRVRWPRGELGSLPADAEQFMLLNHLDTQLEKLVNEVESGSAPFDQQQELTLEWYAQRISELESQVEEIRARR